MLKRALLIVVGVVALLLALPGAASANTNCVGNPSAGCIKNAGTSDRDLLVCRDWSGTSADPGCYVYSPTTFVNQGAWSPYYDSDGYYLPSACNAQVYGGSGTYTWVTSTGWKKLGNGVNWSVNLVC